jgi:hypothetical protein
MKKVFRMSDLGVLSYYMGIEVRQGLKGIELCQSAYAGKLLEKAGMSSCNPCAVPMEPKLKLSKKGNSSPVDQREFRSLIGSLRYLLHTRPELTFSVSYLSRFMEKPHVEHMAVVKHLLHYVAGTLDLGLFYPREGGSLRILGYSDSDMSGDADDSKNTSGMIFFLGGNTVTWNFKETASGGIVIMRGRVHSRNGGCMSGHLGQSLGGRDDGGEACCFGYQDR